MVFGPMFRELFDDAFLNGGYTIRRNYIGLDFIEKLLSLSSDLNSTGYYVNTKAHSFLDHNSDLASLGDDLFSYYTTRPGFKGTRSDEYRILRVTSPGDSTEAGRFHFDSHCATLVIGMQVDLKQGGGLLTWPSSRPMPTNIFSDAFGKVSRYHKLPNLFKFRGLSDPIDLSLGVGDVVLFEGYTCYHGNSFLSPNSSLPRKVLIVHFFDFFGGHSLGGIVRSVRSKFTRKSKI